MNTPSTDTSDTRTLTIEALVAAMTARIDHLGRRRTITEDTTYHIITPARARRALETTK